jgi:hypothetical protein
LDIRLIAGKFGGEENRIMKLLMRHLLLLWTTVGLLGAITSAQAGDKLTVRIGDSTISMWQTADLESARKEAAAEQKPIAWVAASPEYLDGKGRISSNGSRGATLHALYALRDQTVLVFEDGFAENHKVLSIVDDAVHTKDGKSNHNPTLPTVVFLNQDATEVIAIVDFEPDFVKRAHLLADALKEAQSKMEAHAPL